MKEKRKGHSRRRLIWLLGAIVFLLGSYISLPYAQDAFVNWWEDDPFTPLCDVPHLELAFGQSGTITIVQGNRERSQQRFELPESFIAWIDEIPGWLKIQYSPNREMPWYLLDTNTGEFLQIMGDNVLASPDGRYLITSSAGHRAYNRLEVLELSTLRHVYITFFREDDYAADENLRDIQWSPDSRYFVYTRIQGDGSNFEGASSTVLVNRNFQFINLSDSPYQDTGWSPDAQWLVYTQNEGGLYLLSPDETSQRYQITDDTVSAWEFAPDASSIAYLLENEIIIREIPSGRESWRFPASKLGDWSENGLLFARRIDSQNAVELLIANVEQRSLSPAFAQMPLNVARLQWSPSGNAILYQPSDDIRNYLLPYPFRENQELFVIQPSSFRDAHSITDWIMDGLYLAYHGENHWFYLLNTETFQACRMIEAQNVFSYDWRIVPQS